MRELVLRPKREETLNVAQARWLKDNEHDVFLAFRYRYGHSPVKATLYYDVDGCISLRSYLDKCTVSVAVLHAMLVSIAQATALCSRDGMPYYSMLFDPRYVFVDSRLRLHFVFVPLDGMTYESWNSPLLLLRGLSDSKSLRVGSPDGATLCSRLYDYVLAQDKVFSLNSYREFAKAETGVEVLLDGSLGTRDTDGCERETLEQEGRGTLRYALRNVKTGATFDLARGASTILGRGSSCAVRVDDNQKVSRMHASVRVCDKGVLLADLGSTNGTYVGHARLVPLTEQKVVAGQVFRLAGEPFCVEKVGEATFR